MYVIGENKNNTFIEVHTRFTDKLKYEIWRVIYDVSQEQATVFKTFQEAISTYREILLRAKEICFDTKFGLLNIVNNKNGFDKHKFIQSLKIYKLTPQLLSSNALEEEVVLNVAGENDFEEKCAYNYYVLSEVHFIKFVLCYDKNNNINIKENKDLKLALKYIDTAIKLMPNISLYYSSRSEILDLLGYRNEALKDAFMAATLKEK